MTTVTLSVADARRLAEQALTACGCSPANAASQARAVIEAERLGIISHGFAYLPIYCGHLRAGKVDGQAVPKLDALSESAFRCDARDGFALPAIDVAFAALIPAAKSQGLAAVGIRNSYNCGVLGQHTEVLAAEGLVGLGFTNSPAVIAPAGGTQRVLGTNPLACAVPDGQGGAAFVIDQSASVVARSEVALHAREGKAIPEGWAVDADGKPTIDPEVALKGTLLPAGGYKGFSMGLIVEILTAAVSGATLGIHASSFATDDGGPPRTGQFFLALDPERFSGGAFSGRLDDLVGAITGQEGARLPGSVRQAARARVDRDGIAIRGDLHERVAALTEGA